VADTRIDELRRRLERDPGSRLFAQLAEELRKNGELAEAIRVARAGLAVHASYPSARLTLGRALLDSGDAAGGRAELESALRDAPDNILASRFLAQAREALGDLKGAVEQYQKTLQMSPGDRQLQAQLSAVEAKLREPEAESVGSRTTPPTPRVAPPPLPGPGSAPAAAATPARGTPGAVPPLRELDPRARRAAAPPVVAPSPRPAAPAPPEADAESFEGGMLPPTVRLRPGQAARPSPPPPAPPPPPPPPPPVARTEPPRPAAAAASNETARLPLNEFELASTAPPGTVQHTWFAPETPAEQEPLPPTLVDPSHSAPSSRAAEAFAATFSESTAAAQPPDEVDEAESTTPFSSSTLAELYFQQGLVDRAVDVYRQLVQQDPSNERARLRLVELETATAGPEDRAARRRALERTIAGLETLLAAVQRR